MLLAKRPGNKTFSQHLITVSFSQSLKMQIRANNLQAHFSHSNRLEAERNILYFLPSQSK
jgi:hypothetical protein